MVQDIKGPGGKTPPLPANTDQTARTNRDNTPAAPAKSAPPPAARAAADSVNLSSNAQALKTLEEKIQRLPEVNEKRVAEIRAALASGSYKVDELVIADKLLGIDTLFDEPATP
jgi:negative regulator of flagellin synthesis FlgM